jgi:CheY-like chemotaxis protein
MSNPRRILLADDDAEVRLGVADLMLSLGLEVLQVESGLEAIDAVKNQAVDAALLDMHMPGCTGLEALAAMSRLKHDLPCLIYSGRWSTGLEHAALQAGARACLKKPVEPDLLRIQVCLALDMRPDQPWFPRDLN